MSDEFDFSLQAVLPLLALAGDEPDARDLADVLWLATFLDAPPAPARQPETPKAEDEPEAEAPRPEPRNKDKSTPPPAAQAEKPEPEPPKIYPKTSGAGHRPALGFRAPGLPALPNALALSRALKPLRRKLPSRSRKTLDEAATAEAIAAQRLARHGFWAPVWTPVREPWFDLHLVVDGGATMVVWRDVVAEFLRLLERSGAFRRVRTYRLDTDLAEPVLRLGLDAQASKAHVPARLAQDATGPLVLVLSDCAGPAWHIACPVAPGNPPDSAATRWLRQWARTAPLALLQMLPRRLWDGSALGRGEFLRLYSRLAAPRALDLQKLDGAKARAEWLLPVLTLEPAALRTWSRLLNGRKTAWIAGVAFGQDAEFAPRPPPGAQPAEPDAAEIRRRYDAFLAEASPGARKLAGLLAAAPLTLPVMRLVQGRLLRGSGPLHLAELFLSGLVCRSTLKDPHGEPLYDFRPGVRPWLLDFIGERESKQVLCQVSSFVAERTGRALDFAALIAAPSLATLAGAGLKLDDDNTRHFAEIGATVLRRLGGRYAEFAEALSLFYKAKRAGDESAQTSQPSAPANEPLEDSEHLEYIEALSRILDLEQAQRYSPSPKTAEFLREAREKLDFILSREFNPMFTKGALATDKTTQNIFVGDSRISEKKVLEKPRLTLEIGLAVTSLAIQNNSGHILAGCSDGGIRICDIAAGKILSALEGHSEAVKSLAVSPYGTYAISGSLDKSLCVWDVRTGKLVRKLTDNTGAIHAIAISPDGRYVLSASDDGCLRLWNLQYGRLEKKIPGHDGPVYSVAVTPDGRYMLSGTLKGELWLWDINSGVVIRKLSGHSGRITALAVFPDGRFVLSGSEDHALRLWGLGSGDLIHDFIGHKHRVLAVALTSDGRYAISGSSDGTLRIWDVQGAKTIRILKWHTGKVSALAISPRLSEVVSGGSDGTLCVGKFGLDDMEPSTSKIDNAQKGKQELEESSKQPRSEFLIAPVNPPVKFREEAIINLDMVNVLEDRASNNHIQYASGPPGFYATKICAQLYVKAWVRNVAYEKNVWIDIDFSLKSKAFLKPLPLEYLEAGGGQGDVFVLHEDLGQIGWFGPGSHGFSDWNVQYRLYYKVNGQVFTDGILHQHSVKFWQANG